MEVCCYAFNCILMLFPKPSLIPKKVVEARVLYSLLSPKRHYLCINTKWGQEKMVKCVPRWMDEKAVLRIGYYVCQSFNVRSINIRSMVFESFNQSNCFEMTQSRNWSNGLLSGQVLAYSVCLALAGREQLWIFYPTKNPIWMHCDFFKCFN